MREGRRLLPRHPHPGVAHDQPQDPRGHRPGTTSTISSRWRRHPHPARRSTKGSSATTSVHSTGSESSDPSGSNTYTRSARQFRRRLTNSSSRSNNGWNGCVTRTRATSTGSSRWRAVDGETERPLRGLQPARETRRPQRLRLPQPHQPTSPDTLGLHPPTPAGRSHHHRAARSSAMSPQLTRRHRISSAAHATGSQLETAMRCPPASGGDRSTAAPDARQRRARQAPQGPATRQRSRQLAP